MQENQFMSRDDEDLARAISGLEPAPPGIEPLGIWYQAGLKAGRRKASRWRAAAAVSVLVLSLLLLRGRPNPARRIVYVYPPSPAPTQQAMKTGESSSASIAAANLKLRDTLIENGWDALPRPTGGVGNARHKNSHDPAIDF
jgi:hypothetical protein